MPGAPKDLRSLSAGKLPREFTMRKGFWAHHSLRAYAVFDYIGAEHGSSGKKDILVGAEHEHNLVYRSTPGRAEGVARGRT